MQLPSSDRAQRIPAHPKTPAVPTGIQLSSSDPQQPLWQSPPPSLCLPWVTCLVALQADVPLGDPAALGGGGHACDGRRCRRDCK